MPALRLRRDGQPRQGQEQEGRTQSARCIPQWLAGSASRMPTGSRIGGSAQDDVASTTRWNQERAAKIRLLEVRGTEISRRNRKNGQGNRGKQSLVR